MILVGFLIPVITNQVSLVYLLVSVEISPYPYLYVVFGESIE